MFSLPAFRDRTYLNQALTHRSYVNEHPETTADNERLEFLGDAVLNFLSGEFLFKRYPEKAEGELTPLRAYLVGEEQLAQFAQVLCLGEHLKLSRGAELEGGRENANLLSSAFEALIGAYFLDADSDIDSVRAYVEPFFAAAADQLLPSNYINYKSLFQEWALEHLKENPKYIIVNQSGPDHAREFVAEVRVCDRRFGMGKGRRKQDAEKNAARHALEALELV